MEYPVKEDQTRCKIEKKEELRWNRQEIRKKLEKKKGSSEWGKVRNVPRRTGREETESILPDGK